MTPSVEDVTDRLRRLCKTLRDESEDTVLDAIELLDLLRWRDVEKEPPEQDGEYLAILPGGVVWQRTWDSVRGWHVNSFNTPTHWLPMPPTGDSNE